MTIGILAIQGAFFEHAKAIEKIGHAAKLIKKVEDLEGIQGLILPGGESTAMSKQLCENGLMEAIRRKAKEGLHIMGTCAGLILLATTIENDALPTLGLMNIHVKRNAYGRQLGSFKTMASIDAVSDAPVELTFIRAPYIEKIGSKVEVLHSHEGKIVAAKEKNMIALAFHPELTDNTCFHQYFINQILL